MTLHKIMIPLCLSHLTCNSKDTTSECLGQFGLLRQITIDWAASTLFLTVLYIGKLKTKVPADLVSGESPLPGVLTAIFSLCLHTVESRELSRSFMKVLIPLTRSHKHSALKSKELTEWSGLKVITQATCSATSEP